MTVCSCRAVILLGSQRCGGMASVTGAMQWRDTGLLEGQDRKTSRKSCHLCERATRLLGALPGDG